MKKKNNLTELVFILDRSGSMSGLESDTIGGFNAMIQKQKKEDGEAYVSTVLFDNVSEVLHDRVSLKDIPKMTAKDYTVRGCTALIDAIGGAIKHIRNIHKNLRALACLAVLIGHVMNVYVVANVFEMLRHAVADAYLTNGDAKCLHERHGVVVSAVGGTEARHGDADDTTAVKTELVKGLHTHEQRKC